LAHNNVEEEEAFFDLIADTQVRNGKAHTGHNGRHARWSLSHPYLG
jgi:hypothetical protein